MPGAVAVHEGFCVEEILTFVWRGAIAELCAYVRSIHRIGAAGKPRFSAIPGGIGQGMDQIAAAVRSDVSRIDRSAGGFLGKNRRRIALVQKMESRSRMEAAQRQMV